MQETEKIWMNGELVDWADARIHVGSHGLHYGSGVFEGIRAYATAKGTSVFRLSDHLKRLENSARLLYMDLPYTTEELRSACFEVIGVNGSPECYLRPIGFYGYGELGVAATGNPVDVVIMSWPWGAYLGEEGLKKGIRAKISSWQRVGPNVIPHAAKATGVYVNSMLAVAEANRAGYDEAILLTADGFIADGSGENVFVVKDGKLATTPLSTSILPGITRDSLIQIAQDLGYTVEEKNLIRSDLVAADERVEELFAERVGAPYAAAVSSGTAGLHLLCHVAGVGEGDEVITSPIAFIATANCFIYEGATPVFADVDPQTLNIDPASVEEAITDRTKAIVGVDMFGYPCELDELRAIADRHGLALILDSCE